MIEHLLVSGCFGADINDVGQYVPLRPSEAVHVEGSAPKRQRDFALGRWCAHAALVQICRDETMIAKGASGAPLWPAGIVGSITHTDGYAAALVASSRGFQAIGIDAERKGGVTDALMPRLFGAAEQEWLMAMDAEKRETALTILFSAKESFYKAFSGQTADHLSFKDIHIEIQNDAFIARQGGRIAQGRVAVQDDLVVTAVIVP